MAISTQAASAGALVKGLVVAGAVAAGAAGFFVASRAPEAVEQAPALSWAPTTARMVLPVQDSRPVEEVVVEEAPRVSEPPSLTPRSGKPAPNLRLQDEAALLAQVQGSLRNGKGALALSKLESYDRKFPAGMLRAEADAARVFALCSAGRVETARAAAARFVQRYPNAPATARVQAACR